jgi:DNA-binding transcriptional ArsR family regulator
MKMTMPAVTKHLKVLQKAGLIRQERRAQWRPCYLVATPLKEASDWVFQYKQFWEDSFNRLDDYLKVLQAQNVSETVNPKGKRKKER